MHISAEAALEGARELMKHTLCVGDSQSMCGSCAWAAFKPPTIPYCPQCNIKWAFVLPAFLYFTAQEGPLKKEDEDRCFKIAGELGGLIYVARSALARIAPTNKLSYDSEQPWTLA